MEKWIENSVWLAWLIVPQLQQAFIYRKNGSVETIKSFDEKLCGEDVPGFELDLAELK